MHYVTFALLLKVDRSCLFGLKQKKLSFWQMQKPFHTKSEMNTPQAEEKVNSRLYSRTQKKKVQYTSAIKKEAQMFI